MGFICWVNGHKDAGVSHNLLTADTFFENVEKIKYLGVTVKKIKIAFAKKLGAD
jgi:hypothetical protein